MYRIIYAFFTCCCIIAHSVFLATVPSIPTKLIICVALCICILFAAQALVVGRYMFANKLSKKQNSDDIMANKEHYSIAILLFLISVAIAHAALSALEVFTGWLVISTYILSEKQHDYVTGSLGLSGAVCLLLAYLGLIGGKKCMGTCAGKMFCTLFVLAVLGIGGWLLWKKIHHHLV